ncbi:hypothetical protein ABEL47_01655 [Escherichia coli]
MKIDIKSKKFQRDIYPELDAELMSLKNNANDFMSGTIWNEVRTNYDYYFGRLPLVQFDGQNMATDRTCEAVVNATQTDLTTVFTSGDPVRFVAETSNESEIWDAQLATDAVNQIILRENEGQLILSNAIKESLIVGTGFIKHIWKTTTKTMTDKIVSARSDEEIYAFLAGLKDAGVDIEDKSTRIEEHDEDGNRTVTVTYQAKAKSVKLDFVPIEQLLIEENCVSLDECNYIAHRLYLSKKEILDLGFPKEEIDGLMNNYNDDLEVSLIRQSRSALPDVILDSSLDNGMWSDNHAHRVLVYEHYLKTDKIANDGTTHIYQIFEVNNQIFSIEEVDMLPFSDITPMPLGGSIWGESLVALTKDIQVMRTSLKRYSLDTLAKQAYPSYVMSRELDPRELMEVGKRPGVIVRSDNPQTDVNFFPIPTLSQGLDFLFQNSESEIATRTGVNPTQQGINSDMVHAAGLDTANLLLSSSQGRMRWMARNLANTFVKRLMRNVYDIFRNNAEVPLSVETAYGVIKVAPHDLPPRNHILVATALSNAEKTEEANRIMTMVTGLNQIAALQNEFVTPEQKYYITMKYVESMGYKNTRDYATPSSMIPPKQPDPVMMSQVAMNQANAQYLQAQAGALVNKSHQDLESSVNADQLAVEQLKFDNAKFIFEQKKQATADMIRMEELELAKEEVALKNAHNTDITDIKAYEKQTDRIVANTRAKTKPSNVLAG